MELNSVLLLYDKIVSQENKFGGQIGTHVDLKKEQTKSRKLESYSGTKSK
jgi:hypothetical protein